MNNIKKDLAAFLKAQPFQKFLICSLIYWAIIGSVIPDFKDFSITNYLFDLILTILFTVIFIRAVLSLKIWYFTFNALILIATVGVLFFVNQSFGLTNFISSLNLFDLITISISLILSFVGHYLILIKHRKKFLN